MDNIRQHYNKKSKTAGPILWYRSQKAAESGRSFIRYHLSPISLALVAKVILPIFCIEN